jgi:hypothetical protein
MSCRLRTLLIFLPIAAVVIGCCIFLQLEAIRVARESASIERAKAEAVSHKRAK